MSQLYRKRWLCLPTLVCLWLSTTLSAEAFQGLKLQRHNVLSTIFRINAPKFSRSSWRERFQLHASTASDVRDRLGLIDRFDRWRYLQKLLDEETSADDTNQILFLVLDGFLKYPRPKWRDSDETGSPELTPERRALIENILENAKDGKVLAITEADDTIDNEKVLKQLEKILPDPEDDEDGHKGTWDSIIELHGREAVKINEQEARAEWRSRCLLARVIIYYDFLMYGLVDAPLTA